MNRKIATFIAAVSTLSIFSIGFSTWGVVGENISTQTSGNITVDDVDTMSPGDLGIEYHTTLNPDFFGVQGIKDSSTTNYTFTSTKLSFQYTIDKNNDKFVNLEYDDSIFYYLSIGITYTSSLNLFSVVLNAPTKATIMLSNIESIKFDCDITTSSSGSTYSLNTNIPLKSQQTQSLNNIVFMDNYGLGRDKPSIIPFKIVFEFMDNGSTITETQLNQLKTISYSLTMKISGK